ncbi:hypothetical protein EJB05_12155, partial [Eragrostis curvula]
MERSLTPFQKVRKEMPDQVPFSAAYSIVLGRFIKDDFNGQLNRMELDALNDYWTRCSIHFETLKASLMSTSLTGGKEATGNSENISRPDSLARTGTKRSSDRIQLCTSGGYASADDGYVLRRKSKPVMKTSNYQRPDIGNVGVAVEKRDNEQNEKKKVTISETNAIEPPRFDLGIDFDITTNPEPAQQAKSVISTEGQIIMSEDEVHVNAKPYDDEVTESPIVKHVVGLTKLVNSPWFYGLKSDFCSSTEADMIKQREKEELDMVTNLKD